MRRFSGTMLAPYSNIRAWLTRIGVRPARRRAMEIADPGSAPLPT